MLYIILLILIILAIPISEISINKAIKNSDQILSQEMEMFFNTPIDKLDPWLIEIIKGCFSKGKC